MKRCIFVIAVGVWLAYTNPALSKTCFSSSPRSILDDIAEAKIVVIGTFQNAVKPDNALPNGRTEFKIDAVLRNDEGLKKREVVVVDRYRDTGNKKYILAVDVYMDKLDPFWGRELDAAGEMERFITGAMRVKVNTPSGRLSYVAGFLHSSNAEVQESVHADLSSVPYADLRKVAETLKPEPLVKALQDPKLPTGYFGTIALLLGHCAKKEHVAVFQAHFDRADLDSRLGNSHAFVGYFLLDQAAGWERITRVSTKFDGPFLTRYAAFSAIRMLRNDRPDLVSEKQAVAAMVAILPDDQLADFAVESLRKWKQWDTCDTVLALAHLPKHQTPVMKRVILRYALECPNGPAKAYVIQERTRNAEFVQETMAYLELEK